MHTNLRRYTFSGLLLGAGLVILLACGIGPPAPTPFPTLRPTPTPVVLPDFLFFVFPEPGSTIAGIGGGRKPWVTLNLPEIAEAGETLTPEDLQERTWLLVDGQSIAFELSEDYGDGSGSRAWALVSFSPGPGEHRTTIRVRRTSGEILEFSWVFTVDKRAYILPGLPEGFQFVRPLPDSTISRQAYRTERLVPSGYLPGFPVFLQDGVCVGVLGYEIAGWPSYFTAEEVYEMFSIASLDGRPPDAEAISGGYEVPGEVETICGYPPGTVCTPTRAQHDVSAHHYKCVVVDLAPGRHEATAVLEWPDGHVTEFTWWFVITE